MSQPPSGGCVLKRLHTAEYPSDSPPQPPSGGCVLKLVPPLPEVTQKPIQPPSGGCVLKRQAVAAVARQAVQPPSGGCVLKPDLRRREILDLTQPPSGGCVLKPMNHSQAGPLIQPAAFRRLCVETVVLAIGASMLGPSRLQAAVC